MERALYIVVILCLLRFIYLMRRVRHHSHTSNWTVTINMDIFAGGRYPLSLTFRNKAGVVVDEPVDTLVTWGADPELGTIDGTTLVAGDVDGTGRVSVLVEIPGQDPITAFSSDLTVVAAPADVTVATVEIVIGAQLP